MGLGDMLQAEQDAEDAARYRWLRQRMEVRPMTAMDGSSRPAMQVRVGCAFFDSDTVVRNASRDYTKLDEQIDSALRRK